MSYHEFFGQELDCPDDCWYSEWHSCPFCEKTLLYCECDEAEELIIYLNRLYAEERAMRSA